MDLNDAVWRTAGRSGENGGMCVEVAGLPDAVAVRDSKDPGGPVLWFRRAEWARFTRSLKRS